MNLSENQKQALLKDLCNRAQSAVNESLERELNNLIAKGALIVRHEGPIFVQDMERGGISVRTGVSLELKDQQYMNELEEENRCLRDIFLKINQGLEGWRG